LTGIFSSGVRGAVSNPSNCCLKRFSSCGEAKASARRVLDLQPGFTIGSLVSGNFTSRERLSMLADALRQAGLPE